MHDVLCRKQLYSLSSSLLAKPLHGRFYSFVDTEDVNEQKFCVAETTSTLRN